VLLACSQEKKKNTNLWDSMMATMPPDTRQRIGECCPDVGIPGS
jgi:hypothetical protein